MSGKKPLTDEQIAEALREAFSRGYDLGQQHGTDTEKMKWIQRAARDSHERILKDIAS